MNFYNEEISKVLEKLKTNEKGLTTNEAKKRLEQDGRNVLEEKKKATLFQKVIQQISDPMIIVLIIAAVVSGFLSEIADMCIILAVVVGNTIMGLVQEGKAEKAIEALKNMSASTAKVFRDGKLVQINSEELVVGDIISLDAGDLIPADMRLMETSSVKIEEASLTGESVPSEKDANTICENNSPIGDRHNMAYYGTSMTYGRAKGVVTSTGMKTEMGKIANMINNTEDEATPLQKTLAEIGKMLTFIVLGICVVIFATGIIKNGGFTLDNTLESFMISISLAVAAIPEGLPAVVTIVMSMGVTKMAQRKAIIKKLPAVETLGCAEIICSDKTGTLTLNKMEIKNIYLDNKIYTSNEYVQTVKSQMLTNIIYLCNDSEITNNGEEIGDPTETALKRFVLQNYGADKQVTYKRIKDIPFDSERKLMSTVNETPNETLVFTKGAPDELLRRCSSIIINGEVRAISKEDKDNIMKTNHTLATKALRVLGAAYKPYKENEELEENLIFVGLVGMMDPPRTEVFDAIKRCKSAGITPIMITGDHKDTAIAIAREVGILEDESQAIFGIELDGLDDKQLDKKVENIRVYARVSPEHKVRIVQAWKRKGKIVAMTGDGVNDAPALKISDIGVGMGITGTDVSKGVSDMLLSDDNFATIVNAVEEGRKIYTNIRKAVQFLLSSNISEVVSIFIATLLLPSGVIFLSPVHILWINLVTDSLPAVGLGMDKAEDNIMKESPRDSRKSFFADGLGINIVIQGTILGVATLIAYFMGKSTSNEVATTMAFTTLSLAELVYCYTIHSKANFIFNKRLFENRFLNIGIIIPMLLTLVLIYVPFLSKIFKLVPLGGSQWVCILGILAVLLLIIEVIKFVQRKFKR